MVNWKSGNILGVLFFFFFGRSGCLELEAIPQTEPVFGAIYDYYTSNPKFHLLFLVET